MKSILALDVSKNACGWAFGSPDEKPLSGVVSFGKGSHTDDEVWRSGMVWLNERMGFFEPQIVAIEAAIMSSAPGQGGFTNPQSQALLLGLQAVLRTVVKARLPGAAMLVAPSSARKTFTGRGTYSKGEAKDAVQAEAMRRGWLNFTNLNPDRADALCLWCHQAALQLPELAFNQTSKRGT
jgi:hypothetical protein